MMMMMMMMMMMNEWLHAAATRPVVHFCPYSCSCCEIEVDGWMDKYIDGRGGAVNSSQRQWIGEVSCRESSLSNIHTAVSSQFQQ